VLAVATTLVATALFAPPTTIGPVVSRGESHVEQTRDLVEGGWLQLPAKAGNRLLRVGEGGRTRRVGLPPKLSGEYLTISPLQNGWTVAIARYVPAEPPNEECCHGIEEPEPTLGGCCAEWVFAQLDPRGRWTKVQTLPHSNGTLVWVSKPVEHRHHVEIAWGAFA
jgi:hypothetical protein